MTFANPLDSPEVYEGISLRLVKQRAYRAAISGALERTMDVAKASRELSISRAQMYRLMGQLDISPPPHKGG